MVMLLFFVRFIEDALRATHRRPPLFFEFGLRWQPATVKCPAEAFTDGESILGYTRVYSGILEYTRERETKGGLEVSKKAKGRPKEVKEMLR